MDKWFDHTHDGAHLRIPADGDCPSQEKRPRSVEENAENQPKREYTRLPDNICCVQRGYLDSGSGCSTDSC